LAAASSFGEAAAKKGKHMNIKKIYSCLVLSVLINIFFTTFSWAGLRIDKPKVRLNIAPASYDSGEVKVENTGGEVLSVKVYLEDWVYAQQDGGKTFAPKGTNALSCSDWITFYPADFTLAANDSRIVRYTVKVPKDARGGHYSVMFFETGGEDIETPNEEGTTVRIKVLNRLGALFYIEPEGTIKKAAELKNLGLIHKLNDLIVSADLVNSGNTDITAGGTFNIIDKEGFVYARGAFDEVYTLPGDKAALRSVAASTSLKPGTYDILITLDFQNGGTLVHESQFDISADGAISLSAVQAQ